jgi:sugar lactone lactonase YvrE
MSGSADGSGTAASFYNPSGLAVDTSGNLYVADSKNHLIRKITPAGLVSTLAGTGAQGSADGMALSASFNTPTGLVVDGNRNIYVADQSNHLIRKISAAGVVSTWAGTGTQGSANGTGTLASFNAPSGLALDGGHLIVADNANNLIRKISPSAAVTTLAGGGGSLTYSPADDGTGTAAAFDAPYAIALDHQGNYCVAERGSHRLRKITPAGVVTSWVGGALDSLLDGTGLTAEINFPGGIAIDAHGYAYIGDTANNAIRLITPPDVVSTFTGNPSGGAVDGSLNTATFNAPTGVALDTSGNLYVADHDNHLIRKITLP